MKTPYKPTFLRSYIIGATLLLSTTAILALAKSIHSLPQTPLFYQSEDISVRKQSASSTSNDSPLLDSLLRATPQLARVATNPNYELQIIYTQINRDAQNRPSFIPHTFHLNASQYFNPASLVKLPVAVLSLEKLNAINKTGITRNTILATGVAFRCQTPVRFAAPADSDQAATVGNYIKRILLISDNLAYNRLYEFLGQRPLNERLAQLGYPNSRITRRFVPCDTTANRHTNPISFHTRQGDTLYKESAKFNPRPYTSPLGPVLKGRAHQAGGRIIPKPYDFTIANHLPLADITSLLQSILFPATVPPNQRPNLTAADYSFLRRYLHATPHQSGFQPYTPARYFDAYKKYLYYGRNSKLPHQPGLRIYNIVGMSHGYLSDVAYFADSLRQSEFMLSAVLYVNRNGIINDGTYEYESIGLPFLAQLGRTIHEYEAQRPRQFRPNLSAFLTAELSR
ncbi:serine hydrolase [Hymenobacter arizonensis]|uniref:Beta-lactamase enzyme family protein n=1 Tax=Hymenobacter arizonensis TaxID=1227077 RepID=A0A1I5YD67_HYMAR|nr:serine hydrolase [Hymenobacter arizonensis]SFQ42132.1 Beta-lactamase enzyme family protein [Hymenobacter arizonensis]